MNIDIQHTHTREEAKVRIMGLIKKIRAQYGGQIQDFKEEWVNDTDTLKGTAKGISLSGTVDVKDHVVTINLKLPFALGLFSSKIKSTIEEQVKKELA